MAAEFHVVGKGSPTAGRDWSFDGKPKLDFVKFTTSNTEAHDTWIPYLMGPESIITSFSIKVTPADTVTAANYPDGTLRVGVVSGTYDPDGTPDGSTIATADGQTYYSASVKAAALPNVSSGQGDGRWGYVVGDTDAKNTRNTNNKLHPIARGHSQNVLWMNTAKQGAVAIAVYIATADIHALDIQMAFMIGRATV